MLKQIDWVFLRRPLIIFLILIISSLVFYFGGDKYQNIATEDFNHSKNALSTSHSKLNRQSNEIALIDDYLTPYKELVNNAFIGNERRLSWIESMKTTNKEIKLPDFDYSIFVQEEYLRPGIKKTKTVTSYASRMNLVLGVLHEEDIFKVFDLLDKNVQSYFTVEACSLSKNSSSELKVDKENLTVNCVLQWVHLDVTKK